MTCLEWAWTIAGQDVVEALRIEIQLTVIQARPRGGAGCWSGSLERRDLGALSRDRSRILLEHVELKGN